MMWPQVGHAERRKSKYSSARSSRSSATVESPCGRVVDVGRDGRRGQRLAVRRAAGRHSRDDRSLGASARRAAPVRPVRVAAGAARGAGGRRRPAARADELDRLDRRPHGLARAALLADARARRDAAAGAQRDRRQRRTGHDALATGDARRVERGDGGRRSVAGRPDGGGLQRRCRARAAQRTIGSAIQRVTYHYWFHTGEILAIRQVLGHARLPEFVGNIDAERRTGPDDAVTRVRIPDAGPLGGPRPGGGASGAGLARGRPASGRDRGGRLEGRRPRHRLRAEPAPPPTSRTAGASATGRARACRPASTSRRRRRRRSS